MKLSDFDSLGCERAILRKMLNHRWIGPKHTAYDNLHRGFGPSDGGRVKDTVDGLIKRGLIIEHPAHYGKQVSLNGDRLKEIKDLLGFDYKDYFAGEI